MTAAVASTPKSLATGLRPVNPRKDLPQVANLIEVTFADQLDAGGRRLVREMRTLGRTGWLGWIVGQLFLPAAAAPLGYVWEEQGRIVGNASLLDVAGHPDRYVLANVAVEDAFRGRGIGRSLIAACLDLARNMGTRTLLLQVDHDNHSVRELYHDLGFSKMGTWTTWIRKPASPFPKFLHSPSVRRRDPQDWEAQWQLARRLYPLGLQWPFPLSPSLFRPTRLRRLLGWDTGRHWVAWEGEQLTGSVSVYSSQSKRAWRAFLLVQPDLQGKLEEALLTKALSETADGLRAMALDYPMALQSDLLERLQFQKRRTLTWMHQRLD